MSTPQLFLPPSILEEEEEQPQVVSPVTAPVVSGYDLWRQKLGLVEEQEPEDFNAMLSFLAGAGVGVAEPLTMIPQVGDAVDRLRQYRAPDDELVNKVSYALGWFAGSLIPGSAAFKLGGLAARGLGLTVKAIKAGETVTDLTRLGVLVRGGVAGAAYAAGQEADTPTEWAANVATDAALFGVGDLVLDPVLRAFGSRIFRSREKPPTPDDDILKEIVEDAATEGAEFGDSEFLARALQVVDDIVEREAATSTQDFEGIAKRKLKMQLGLEELGLEEVRDGVMKIVPVIGADIEDVRKVIDQLGDFQFSIVERTTQSGRKVQDAIIGRKGMFDYRMADEYKKFGFVQGQEVIWKGKKRVLVKGAEDADFVLGYSADNPSKKLHRIPLSRGFDPSKTDDAAHLLPHLYSRAVPGLPDPGKWWAKFVQDRGELPDSFQRAFDEFTQQYAIFGKTKQDLKLFFLRKQRDIAKQIDPELFEVLERVGISSGVALKRQHPERKLDVIASQKGFVRDWIYDPDTDSWIVLLVDHKSGNKLRFKSQIAAEEFLINYGVEPPPLLKDVSLPIGEEALTAGIQGGASVQVAHSAVEASNFKAPVIWQLSNMLVPREAHVRKFDDLLRQQGIRAVTFKNKKGQMEEIGINLWGGNVKDGVVVGGLDNIRRGINVKRNEMNGLWAPEGRENVDWLALYRKVRGGMGKKSRIRDEVHEDWDFVFESKKANWESLNKFRKAPAVAYNEALKTAEGPLKDLIKAARSLNDEEWNVLTEMRDIYNKLFDRAVLDPNIKISGDDFIEDYLPHIRRKSARSWSTSVEQALNKKGKKISTEFKDFIHEMERTGRMKRYEKDPYVVLASYMNGLFFRSHVTRHWKETARMVNALRSSKDVPRTMDAVTRSMADYLQMMYGGLPESYFAVSVVTEQVFEDLGIKLSKASFDRFVNTLVSLNYGAFLGLRIGPALRNLSQSIVVTLPRVGSANLSRGIESVFRNPSAAFDELYKAGVLVERGIPLPVEDAVLTKIVQTQVRDAMEGKALKSAKAIDALIRTGGKLSDVSTFTLGGEVEILGKKIPIGLFGKMDDLNRAIAYFAQKHKTIKAINNWKTERWSTDKFNDAAGLTQFGESVTTEFHRRMTTSQDDAIRYISSLLADDTQWIYQLGAGPPIFAQGLGRLFGMYGTWPAWYATHLYRGSTQGSKADKIRFWGWTAATTAAFSSAAYFTGINLSRWTGISSFEWTGGPFFDWFKDITTIWSGVQESGEPTAGRELALAGRGLDDVGVAGLHQRFGPAAGLVGSIPGNPGQIAVDDPAKLFTNTVGMFTPGAYFLRDILQASRALKDDGYGAALTEMLGLTMASSVGGTWPEVSFK